MLGMIWRSSGCAPDEPGHWPLGYQEAVFKQNLHVTSETAPQVKGAGETRSRVGRGIFFLLGMAFMGLLHVLAPFFHQVIISEAPPLVANARANQPAMVVPGWQKPW